MTRRVVRLRPGDTVRDALRAFALNRITGAPVVDERGRVVGILTEMDILRRLELGSLVVSPGATRGPGSPGGREERDSDEGAGRLRQVSLAEALGSVLVLRVSQLMTSPAVTVHPGDSVEEKMALMIHRRIRRLPVVDSRGVLVGVVSRKDLIKVLHVVAGGRGGRRGAGCGAARGRRGGR